MGSGKSTVGASLAARMGYDFIDLDAFIEAKTGNSISEIFEKKGEITFRKLEAKALRAIARKENCIIATGGGTPCFHKNMQWILDNGFCVFLDIEIDILLDRLSNDKDDRPILAGLSRQEMEQKIGTMLENRLPIYQLANLCILQKKGGPPSLEILTKFIKGRMPYLFELDSADS